MIICLEGADGTGKSTLAEAFRKELGAETYLHAGCKYVRRMHLYHTAILRHAVDRVERTGRPVILDRWWPSELVYAAVYRGGTRWPLMGRMMDRVFTRYGGVYVVCQADPEHEKRFARLREERFEMFEDMTKVVAGYDELYWNHSERSVFKSKEGHYSPMERWPHVFGFLMKFTSPEALVNNVRRHLQRPRYPQLQTCGDNFLGNLNYADTLFVGDQAKVKGSGSRVWPFYEYANSSLYLARELDRLRWPEYRGVWTNINDTFGAKAVERCLDHVRRVVVFGDRAAHTFHSIYPGVEFHHCLHPQSARRFPHQREKFTTQLKEALNVGSD